MGKASRDKGKRGEREVVDLFCEKGYEARRTAQVDGSLSSDVVLTSPAALHIEVKRRKRIVADDFMKQAEHDALTRRDIDTFAEVVFMREDGGPWRVIVSSEFFFNAMSEMFPPRKPTP